MKNKKTPPRKQRLMIAKTWIPTYEGKSLFRGYRKHFGLSNQEALSDLQLLGYEFDEQYIKCLVNNKKKRRKHNEVNSLEDIIESDYYFYYIAGYTENGVPFGITWEEAEQLGLIEDKEITYDDNLPF